MENYSAMIRNTFELCSVRDGEALFEACVQNAFPTFRFRHLELIRIDPDRIYLEGRMYLRFRKPPWKVTTSGWYTATGSPWGKPRTNTFISTI